MSAEPEWSTEEVQVFLAGVELPRAEPVVPTPDRSHAGDRATEEEEVLMTEAEARELDLPEVKPVILSKKQRKELIAAARQSRVDNRSVVGGHGGVLPIAGGAGRNGSGHDEPGSVRPPHGMEPG